jgi:hypothetical protein
MVERRQHARFALEAPQTRGIAAKRLSKRLERDFAPQTRVEGAIDTAHAADAEQIDDLIATETLAGRGQ